VPTLRPEAAEALDARAQSLLSAMVPASSLRGRLLASEAALPVAAHVGQGDVLGEIRVEGEHRLPVVRVEGQECVLSPSGVSDYVKLLSLTMKQPGISESVHDEYVAAQLSEWFRGRLEQGGQLSWSEALVAALDRDVVARTVYVMLNGLSLDVSFSVGPTRVSFFDRSLAALWASPERYIRTYQGRPFASITVTTDPISLLHVGRGAAENTVQVLRFFHPAATNLRVRCGVARTGAASDRVEQMAFLTEGARSLTLRSAVSPNEDIEDYRVTAEVLEAMRQEGLDVVSGLLANNEPTELQEDAWSALNVFSRGIELDDETDRVIHALIAAEKLLLSEKPGELLQQNLRYRLAHLVETDLESRKRLGQDVTTAYAARSAFVHRGKRSIKPEDVAACCRVLGYIRKLILACIAPREERTCEEFRSRLDDLILT
jgi:Apea-like HEPN